MLIIIRNIISRHKKKKRKILFLYLNLPQMYFKVEDLPSSVQEQMLEELLDKEAQQQLEGGGGEPPALNWSLEITERLGSRLHALWNRSAGDCLLDSTMQATWGVFDRDNALRRALADTLQQAGQL